ncbi:MAG: TRAP transporter permease DctQ, partial [Pseudomonadota bacterium]
MTAFVEIMGTGLVWIGLGLSPLILLPIIILVVRRPTARFARFVTQVLDRISGAAFALAMIAALAIIMIQLAGVLLRYVFGLSFSWLTDSVIFSF